MELHDLEVKQLDESLSALKKILPNRPRRGWIWQIRHALGMTVSQLATRMHVAQPTLSKIESSEVHETISIGTLSRAADALNCDLVYVFIPRQELAEMISNQMRLIAKQRVTRVAETMALESQGISAEFVENQINSQMRKMLNKRPRKFWG